MGRPLAAATAAQPVTLTGTITSILSSTEFNYQTGSPYGHVPVLYSASMVAPSGSTIKVGQPVTVLGSFNAQHQLVATTVTIIPVYGSVTSILSPTQFTYQTGNPYGLVPVLYSASMVAPSGSTIKVGQSLAVMGSFNSLNQLSATAVTVVPSSSPSPAPSLSPTPTPTATPVPSGLYHIATWAADSAFGQGSSVSAASVNQLATYAIGDGKALSDCHSSSNGCKAMFYVDPNHSVNNSPASCVTHPDADAVAAASESWFVHDTGFSDSAHRVYG